MSTRATYQINDKTFYIHHDGYAEGAAAYFFNMCQASLIIDDTGVRYSPLDRNRTKGGLEFAFIRGNGNCEPTESHEAHGDTEYKYTITSGKGGVSYMDSEPMLKAYARVAFGDEWRIIHDGKLTDFINEHAEEPVYKSITGGNVGTIFIKIDDRSGETLLCTVEQAVNAEKAFAKKGLTYDEDNHNRQHNLDFAQAIDRAMRNKWQKAMTYA